MAYVPRLVSDKCLMEGQCTVPEKAYLRIRDINVPLRDAQRSYYKTGSVDTLPISGFRVKTSEIPFPKLSGIPIRSPSNPTVSNGNEDQFCGMRTDIPSMTYRVQSCHVPFTDSNITVAPRQVEKHTKDVNNGSVIILDTIPVNKPTMLLEPCPSSVTIQNSYCPEKQCDCWNTINKWKVPRTPIEYIDREDTILCKETPVCSVEPARTDGMECSKVPTTASLCAHSSVDSFKDTIAPVLIESSFNEEDRKKEIDRRDRIQNNASSQCDKKRKKTVILQPDGIFRFKSEEKLLRSSSPVTQNWNPINSFVSLFTSSDDIQDLYENKKVEKETHESESISTLDSVNEKFTSCMKALDSLFTTVDNLVEPKSANETDEVLKTIEGIISDCSMDSSTNDINDDWNNKKMRNQEASAIWFKSTQSKITAGKLGNGTKLPKNHFGNKASTSARSKSVQPEKHAYPKFVRVGPVVPKPVAVKPLAAKPLSIADMKSMKPPSLHPVIAQKSATEIQKSSEKTDNLVLLNPVRSSLSIGPGANANSRRQKRSIGSQISPIVVQPVGNRGQDECHPNTADVDVQVDNNTMNDSLSQRVKHVNVNISLIPQPTFTVGQVQLKTSSSKARLCGTTDNNASKKDTTPSYLGYSGVQMEKIIQNRTGNQFRNLGKCSTDISNLNACTKPKEKAVTIPSPENPLANLIRKEATQPRPFHVGRTASYIPVSTQTSQTLLDACTEYPESCVSEQACSMNSNEDEDEDFEEDAPACLCNVELSCVDHQNNCISWPDSDYTNDTIITQGATFSSAEADTTYECDCECYFKPRCY